MPNFLSRGEKIFSKVKVNLLLIENGRLSPGGGTPCPPRLAALVASPRVEISLANIFSRISYK